MNHRVVFSVTGRVVKTEAAMFCLPLLVALCYAEWRCAAVFAGVAAATFLIGLLLTRFFKPGEKEGAFAKDGLLIVAIAWIFLSVMGAVPFVLTGDIPNYADAFFETVSGFTTTGATVLGGDEITSMTHGCLLWRSFTHWIGGMGVLVFIVMLTAKSNDRSINILRAEMPGPTMDKLKPRLRDSVRILYLVYIALTVLEMIFLLFGGMSLFDAMIHAFGTAGTGGFSSYADSLTSASPYLQWVIAVFMLLFGINFNLFFLLLAGRVKEVFRSSELRWYLGIVAAAVVIIGVSIYPLYHSVGEVLRLSFFQVSSIITTTGFTTADYALWPLVAQWVLLTLMFIGGCAGSTAGGLKVSRVVILFRTVRREVRRVLHPNAVQSVKFEGKSLSPDVIAGVTSYFALYAFLYVLTLGVLTLDPHIHDFLTHFTAVSACINNVGPGLGAVGPTGSFGGYSIFSKVLLSFAMLLGRLEIYPILLLFLPATWSRKS